MFALERPGEWLIAVMLCAAAWRLTHLMMYESGPWNVITRVRSWTGVKHDEDGFPMGYPDGNVFECFLCFSVWVAAILTIVVLTPAWPLVTILAASAFAIWAEKAYKGGSRRN